MLRRLLPAAVIGVGIAGSAGAESITILGGGVSGGPYQMAVALSKVLKTELDIDSTPQSAQGMVGQARILGKEEAEFTFGLGGPIGAWAYAGKRNFEEEGAKDNLRAVASYPTGGFQWIALADTPYESVSDLEDARISLGSPGSATQTFGRLMLPALGLDDGEYDERLPGFSEGFGALRDGNVDAHLTLGPIPLGAIQELTAVKEIRLLDMDPAAVEKVVAENGPGIAGFQIDPDTYGENQVNEAPVNSIVMFYGFTTHAGTSDDLVYKVTKALFENLDEMAKSTNAAKELSLEQACAGLSMPLHPGAKRYYDEVGLTGCE